MFVTSGNRGGEFWWDRLVRLRMHDPDAEICEAAVALEGRDAAGRSEALRELELDRP
jgi:hypothetical protein